MAQSRSKSGESWEAETREESDWNFVMAASILDSFRTPRGYSSGDMIDGTGEMSRATMLRSIEELGKKNTDVGMIRF